MPPPLTPSTPRAGGSGASSSSSSALQDARQMRDKLQSLEEKMKKTRRDIEAGYHITPQNSGPTSAPRWTDNCNYSYKTSEARVYASLAHDPRTPPALTVPTGAAMAGLARPGSLGQRSASRLADVAKTKRK